MTRPKDIDLDIWLKTDAYCLAQLKTMGQTIEALGTDRYSQMVYDIAKHSQQIRNLDRRLR